MINRMVKTRISGERIKKESLEYERFLRSHLF